MIPTKLWHTWKTHKLPKSLKSQSDSWRCSNPQLEKTLMGDAECSDFILEHFGETVHDLYLALPQPIMRADFWRLAVVYVHGGYYSDLDIICNVRIDVLTNNHDKAVFIIENNNVANFFFGAEPKHPVIELALDYMIEEAKRITDKDVQSFGMHSLHRAVREYYKVVKNNYSSNDEVFFINNKQVKNEKKFIHANASLFNSDEDYISWRLGAALMNQERENSHPILFFTTFNKNGYTLYGKDWIRSFIALANYYTKFHAEIYYEGFTPSIEHPNITWINYEDVVPHHPEWKRQYLDRSRHTEYVKTMTIRFSHKAFVIQHVLDSHRYGYLIWLDGDCVFKQVDYAQFPESVLGGKFLACQVEHNRDLNHVESGVLIFQGNHPNTARFNTEFKKRYRVDDIVSTTKPYDGFVIYKTLSYTSLDYADLNLIYGKGGIQSDPEMTFCHPELRSRFVHNIGWAGKSRYAAWGTIKQRDDVYKKMDKALFGSKMTTAAKKATREKLQRLKTVWQTSSRR